MWKYCTQLVQNNVVTHGRAVLIFLWFTAGGNARVLTCKP